MDVLVALAAHPGEVVTRAQLHEQVWPNVVVSEKALTRTISVLRKVFGDDPRDPRFIATVAKTGYRLIAPVSYLVDPPACTGPTSEIINAPRRWKPVYVWSTLLLMSTCGSFALWLFSASTAMPSLGKIVPFTTFPGHEVDPAFAPDGQTLAFAWDGPDGQNWDIYVKQPGMEQPLRLTTHPARDRHPIWSPDGTQVAFVRHEGTTCAIITVPALSGPERRLAPCSGYPERQRIPRTFKAAWSPDGTLLAHEDAPSDTTATSIYLLALDTQTRTRITRPDPSFLGDTAPVFSPSGDRLTFIRYRDWGQADLYAVDLDGQQERQLTFEHRTILGHGWLPEGNGVLFSMNRHGLFQLWHLHLVGGLPTWVPLSGANVENVAVAHQSGRLVYENWLYDVNLWRTSVEGDQRSEAYITSTLWDVDPAYASDGRLAFISNRSGSYEVWTRAPDGSSTVQLTQLQGPRVRSPRWSPDNSRLAFAAATNGQTDLYAIDVAGGSLQHLSHTDADEVAPVWSTDGQDLYFGSNRGGMWRIWKMPAHGGTAVPVTQSEGYAAQLTSDGTVLYFAKNDEPGLWRMPTSGGPATLALHALAPGDWGNWSVAEEGIYFVRRTPDPRRAVLAFYAFATSEIENRMVFPVPPPRYQQGLALSPDGQWMVHAQIDRTQSDLLLAEVLP